VALYHVNFHTLGQRPIFEVDEYDAMMRACLPSVLRQRRVVCLAWELMPTHVHLLIEDFLDYSRATILQHVKGDTGRAFFHAFPRLREDLLGDHLWLLQGSGAVTSPDVRYHRLHTRQSGPRRSASPNSAGAKHGMTMRRNSRYHNALASPIHKPHHTRAQPVMSLPSDRNRRHHAIRSQSEARRRCA
jgi:REP element-mobilizing transposase RayT